MDGKNFALTAMICGIASAASILLEEIEVMVYFGLALGIVAIVMAVKAKKKGYVGGMRSAGFVLGIIGTSLWGLDLLMYMMS
ncbi:MAG: hypothetical protein HDT24_02980 [Ruminococcus sp.]|nr:hypothetical protein [Ruminococcus sp.]